MQDFKIIKDAVAERFREMEQHPVFLVTSTAEERQEFWDCYIKSFPEGSNPIFREYTEHDCSCCKQFIRAVGGVVSIDENYRISTIWDISVGGAYQVVADALAAKARSSAVKGIFKTKETSFGADVTFEHTPEGENMVWSHFCWKTPRFYLAESPATEMGKVRQLKEVFGRALEELTDESLNIALELVDQGSLYRGDEHKDKLLKFREAKRAFSDCGGKDVYLWRSATTLPFDVLSIRNSAVGTLLINLSEGMDIEHAVGKYEHVVAPTNYKRPKACVTKAMIDKAEKQVQTLGFETALQRRFAIEADLTINNVLFVNREAHSKLKLSIFDSMKKEIAIPIRSFGKVEEVSIDTFLKDILPTTTSIEAFVENRHKDNLVSLIAPTDQTSKNMFSWGNNFCWAYAGGVADSMKENVRRAGGDVEGVLRFSIQWNEDGDNSNDLDAHCFEPCGNHISYPRAGRRQRSSGVLDVDITNPKRKTAVENITWSDKSRMGDGDYKFEVHNYFHRGGTSGFTAEIEWEGNLLSFRYDKELRQDEKVEVGVINLSKTGEFSVVKSLPDSTSSLEVWGLNTQTFVPVKMLMASPNHWDGEKTGNKHYLFILEDCINDTSTRGFFNEFLASSLHDHRRVFEFLGGKIKVEASDDQLSGVGFSTTQRNSLLCKVTGAFTKTIKVTF